MLEKYSAFERKIQVLLRQNKLNLGDETQIHICFNADAGHIFSEAVLPHVHGIVEIGKAAFRQGEPELIVCQSGKVIAIVTEVAVEIHTGLVACVLNSLAESDGTVCTPVHFKACSACAGVFYLLPVKNNGRLTL